MNISWPYVTVRLKKSVFKEKEINILKHGFYPKMFTVLEYN